MKKIFAIFSILLILCSTVSAKNYYNEAYKSMDIYVDDYAPACVNGKCGFVDKHNKFVVPPKYPSVQNARGTHFFVCKDYDGNKCAYMNKKTKKILTRFKYVGCGNGDISEGFFDDMAKVVIDKKGKWYTGYINESGKEVIKAKYLFGGSFSESLAQVQFPNGKYGYINKKGDIVIKPKYSYATPFKKGIAKVRIQNHFGAPTKEINKKGEIIR